jgi:UDP-2,3-diacylglucosamine hydrolase
MIDTAIKTPLTYFIADLHLAENRPDITACFLSFLQNEAPKAEVLYIIGDLFEYWVGDDDNSPFIVEISRAIKTLSTLACKIYFIHGNRDFLLGKRFAKQCGMQLLPEVTLIDLYGKPVVIMHGDTLCTRDLGYQAFRRKSRSWWWQGIIKSLPLFVRRKIADNYRVQSATATEMKSQDIMDVTENEVINCLGYYQSQLMIHGHTHRPHVHNIMANNQVAQRIVLGDWYEQGAWLKVTPNSMELMNSSFESSKP